MKIEPKLIPEMPWGVFDMNGKLLAVAGTELGAHYTEAYHIAGTKVHQRGVTVCGTHGLDFDEMCDECARTTKERMVLLTPRGDGTFDRVEATTHDPVNHPKHYTSHPSGVEVIQITEYLNFCLGNAVKYILRCDEKGKPIEDLKKAIWYLQREIARREANAS
jgi:Protein of unknwon function (DUF3310)